MRAGWKTALCALAALLSACSSEPRTTPLVITFVDSTLGAGADELDLRVYQGGCDGALVMQVTLTREGNAPPLDGVPAGTYGVVVRAADEQCRWIASACVTRTLPLAEGETIEVQLDALEPPVARCGEGACCAEGVCGIASCTAPDGGMDAGPIDAGPSIPATPALRSPRNGAYTGSVHATRSLTPTFRWAEVDGADRYEIELAPCEAELASCADALADPAAPTPDELRDDTLTGTSYTPASELPVSTTAPVGRRYVWHVRACNELGCSPWSDVRYVEVGRLPNDFNGDGYSDLAISAPGAGSMPGKVYVYYGSSNWEGGPPADPPLEGDSTVGNELGVSLAAADLDADGYSDLAVGRYHGRHFFVWMGAAEGLRTGWQTRHKIYGPQEGAFGRHIAPAGDVNRDGYPDLLVSLPLRTVESQRVGRVRIYLGGDSIDDERYLTVLSPEPTDGGRFGASIAGGIDVNADGYGDFLVGQPGATPGVAFLYFGPPPSEPATWTIQTLDPAVHLDPGTQEPDCGEPFAERVSGIGDVNGDFFGDVALSVSDCFVLFAGGPATPSAAAVIDRQDQDEDIGFARALGRAGDLDHDGDMDLVVGVPQGFWDQSGAAYLYDGDSSALAILSAERWAPNVSGSGAPRSELVGPAQFGFAVHGAGDVDGDGDGDLVFGAPTHHGSSGAETYGPFGRAFVDLRARSATSSVISLDGSEPGARFGYAVTRAAVP